MYTLCREMQFTFTTSQMWTDFVRATINDMPHYYSAILCGVRRSAFTQLKLKPNDKSVGKRSSFTSASERKSTEIELNFFFPFEQKSHPFARVVSFLVLFFRFARVILQKKR